MSKRESTLDFSRKATFQSLDRTTLSLHGIGVSLSLVA